MRTDKPRSPASKRPVRIFDHLRLTYLGFGPLGEWGEAKAARYLKSRGALVWAKNWTCRSGEIDIVVLVPRCLIFVEVKTRMRNTRDGFTTREALTDQKVAQVYRVAQSFLRYNRFALEKMAILDHKVDYIGITARRSRWGGLVVDNLVHRSHSVLDTTTF